MVAAAMVMPAAMFEFPYRSRIWADRISCPLESCWIRAAPVAEEVGGMYGYRVLLRYHDSKKSCLRMPKVSRFLKPGLPSRQPCGLRKNL
jgi:hypothetical protein